MMTQQQELNPRKFIPIAILIAAVILFLISWNSITVTIEAGHSGVLFKRFGGGIELDRTYGEGFHLIAPWNKMYIYEVRQQEIAEEMNVLSSNALEIYLDVSAWYQPQIDRLGHLHAEIGSTYLQRVVIPSLRASARSVVGRYTPEQIYSTKRDAIQDEIFEETKALLDGKNVQLNQILIRSIKLPATIKEAVESKLQQEQLSLEYEFKLERAKQEAERQKIEAEGKAMANDIINASLTDKILREKGIEATLKLAESPNAKVVVIGNTKDGMPLILGDSK
jgi:regulator of protease activity HflC (stomatin/prohibitin superfamily)